MSARSKRGKFENYCRHVASHFEVLSGKEQFYQSNEMVLRCKHAGHEKALKATSIANKMCVLKDLSLWCNACNRESRFAEKTQSFAQQMDEKVGHSIVSVDWSTRRVEYKCVNCGETRQNYVHNLKRKDATGRCDKCQNDDRRVPFQMIRETAEKNGKTILTCAEEYRCNSQKLRMQCTCGNEYTVNWKDFSRRDSSCMFCKVGKFEATCMRLYGVRNVSQLPEVMEKIVKSGYTSKDYTLPSGTVIRVQGWEPDALDYLFQSGMTEDQLTYSSAQKPSIPYEDADGGNHVYHPDFYEPSSNTVIEVKCYYTLLKDVDINRRKWLATLEGGYIFRLILFNDSRKLDRDWVVKSVEDFHYDDLINEL